MVAVGHPQVDIYVVGVHPNQGFPTIFVIGVGVHNQSGPRKNM